LVITIDHFFFLMPKKPTGFQEEEEKSRRTTPGRTGGFENRDPPKTDEKWALAKSGLSLLPDTGHPERSNLNGLPVIAAGLPKGTNLGTRFPGIWTAIARSSHGGKIFHFFLAGVKKGV